MSEHTQQQNQASVPTWLSAALLIVAALTAANLFVFVYEVAYCHEFGIPTSFISLSPTVVFVVAAGLIVVFALLLCLSDMTIGIFRDVPRGPISRRLAVLFPFVVLSVALLYLYGDMWEEWVWAVVLVAILAFFEFVFPLIFQREGSYREKLEAQAEIDRRWPPLIDWLRSRLLRALVVVIVTLIFGLLIAYAAGRAEALRQDEFLVVRSDTEAVVLRHYGDSFILAPFDRESKQVERSFFILKDDDESQPLFTLEKIGPLTSTD
ncbi:MAG: hypothetical protein JSU97_02845 [Dehalococcoidia bacterium]|nr:MAG: hypothetical protein JSU97_02845 [Dehalococcoidia bacterium]